MKALKITMLYPQEMNIYGDHGNLEILTHRAELYGYKPKQVFYEPGDEFPMDSDIILGGGGQDSGQGKIMNDLVEIAPKLLELVKADVPMLMICGLYQMFGHYFQTIEGQKISGIGIFDAYTEAGSKRLIGNIITDWDGYQLIGYENHSGLTFLNDGQDPFARVIKGFGNDDKSVSEGARINNVFGSYLHGPILSKNPKFTDELLALAVKRKFGDRKITPADASAKKALLKLDILADQARRVVIEKLK